MGYTNSSLIKLTKLSPNYTSGRKNFKLDTITIHCYVGQVTAERGADTFAKSSRQASCNYIAGTDGNALVVEEKNRSWCTGGSYKNNGRTGSENDYRACTFEVACDSTAPYAVRDDVYQRLLDLVTDVCKRNGISKLIWSENKNDRINHLNGCNLTVHRDYDARSCPGDWLYKKMPEIASIVSSRLSAVTPSVKPSTSTYMYSCANGASKVDFRPVFDSTYYSKNNADVVKVFGTKDTDLFKHFTQYGMNECRKGNEAFDPKAYANANPDVKAAYGSDWKMYYDHYCRFGKNEGRKLK